jgi:nucleoside-diphosphate-sugar epimerase
MSTVVIFGGTGFIGTHFAQHLLTVDGHYRIILADMTPPRRDSYTLALQNGLQKATVSYVQVDVRKPIPPGVLPLVADLVVNLAAIHREPGHVPKEYFETNLLGAENVCNWAASVGCPTVVFTSSISPYGPTEDCKNEATIPVPETAYGSSKLAAEKIHLAWQAASPDRELLIVRPGVVFGPGEGGNVTRLVRSLRRGYFFYTGNRQTIKAAGYVKELCLVISFGLQQLREGKSSVLLLNFTLQPPPTMEDMVTTMLKVLGLRRKPFSVPRALMLGIQQPINPVRVRKLFRSTNIAANTLQSLGYRYSYTLESALADWKNDLPKDFD